MAKSNPVDEFLNPKSMLTPGMAGSLTTLITNSLVTQFDLVPSFTGLFISFLFGLLVFAGTRTVLWLKFVLYVLNSLLIFSVALGANQIGVGAAKRTKKPLTNEHGHAHARPSSAPIQEVRGAYFSNWLDGTVPRRKELLLSVHQLEDSDVKNVLMVLGTNPDELRDPKLSLVDRTAYARTSEQVEQIDRAVSLVKKGTREQRK